MNVAFQIYLCVEVLRLGVEPKSFEHEISGIFGIAELLQLELGRGHVQLLLVDVHLKHAMKYLAHSLVPLLK